MYRRISFPSLLALTALAIFLGCAESRAEKPSGPKTFSGTYQWSQGGSGALDAEFRPDGDDTWKIKFRFDFNSKKYTWKGTAKGNLEDGSPITGTAKGGGGRTWEFEGSINDGVMTARHAEKRDGDLQQTGTFKLSR